MKAAEIRRHLFAQRLGLTLLSLGLCAGVVELVARASLPDGYYVWPPNYRRTVQLPPDALQGVRGPSTLTINDTGMRGDPIRTGQRYRLLAVGGSTTICTCLDDREAWPHLVQGRVNAVLGEDALWVGNVGRPGHTTAQHVLQVEKLLAQHPEIDAVILLIGINDFVSYLHSLRPQVSGSKTAQSLRRPALEPPARRSTDAAFRIAFSLYPGWDAELPWYQRTGIARQLATTRWRVLERTGDLRFLDRTGTLYEEARALRRRARFRDSLPDLRAGLARYEKGILDTIEAARDTRVILLTQPTLWRSGLSPEEEDLIWGVGPPIDQVTIESEFYTTEALATGMKSYNERLLQACRTRKVECLDLAKELPRDGSVFSDDAHLTERGSRMIAAAVADYLLARPPFSSP